MSKYHSALPKVLTIDTEGWGDFFNTDANVFDWESPSSICSHKWSKTELIFSTVYDCEYCGIKREDVEPEYKRKLK